jgi:hypothetical protein
MPENLTNKRCRIIQDWSDEDKENDLTGHLLNPRWRKDVEQTDQEGPSKPVVASAQGMPTASTAATSHMPPPSDGGQGSSGQQGSQEPLSRRAFSATRRQVDM